MGYSLIKGDMVLTFAEGKKHLSFIQSKNMQFCEVNDLIMAKRAAFPKSIVILSTS